MTPHPLCRRRATLFALRAPLVPLLLSLVVFHAASQVPELVVERRVSLPPEFFVGDRVELRLQLAQAGDGELRVPEPLPQPAWGRVEAIRVIPLRDTLEVRLNYVPLRPGTLTFPPLDLGGGRISALTIFVDSILENRERETEPPAPQLQLSGTRALVAIGLAILIGLPLLLVLAATWGRRQVSSLVQRIREGRPYRRIQRTIRTLSSQNQVMQARDFYIVLIDEFRSYLTARLGVDCRTLTTSELGHLVSRSLPDEADKQAIIGAFRTGDLVKFARRGAGAVTRREHLDALTQAVQRIERQRVARRRGKRQEVLRVDR